jgi:acyl-coenzyme A thioesterase PaaI-like protein
MARPGYFHGGIIGGLLEMAGFAALTAALEQQGSMCGSRPGRPTATARWPVAG